MAAELKTKNVFLTGGAHGLGKCYVDGFLAEGARVVFGDIDAKVGEATEREFAEKYGKDKIKFLQFDVTNESKFEEAFQRAVEFLGYVDLMVNNAGILNEELWQLTIALNYAGMVKGTYLAYNHMRKDKGGKGGRIINISSGAGLEHVRNYHLPVYTGTKHAVTAFTQSMALAPDVKELGIEYGVLCPGPTNTFMLQSVDDKKLVYFDPETQARYPPRAPPEHIRSGLLKLVHLEDMNGAMFFIDINEQHFCTVEKVVLGDDWPVQEKLAL